MIENDSLMMGCFLSIISQLKGKLLELFRMVISVIVKFISAFVFFLIRTYATTFPKYEKLKWN